MWQNVNIPTTALCGFQKRPKVATSSTLPSTPDASHAIERIGSAGYMLTA